MMNNMMTIVSSLIDILSNFERIRDSPVPIAYKIHLKQSLLVYLISIPFQLVATMGWATIIVVFMASFTFHGLEAIGHEIENPFGYDENDLYMEGFCEQLKSELNQITDRSTDLDSMNWSDAVTLTDSNQAQHVRLQK